MGAGLLGSRMACTVAATGIARRGSEVRDLMQSMLATSDGCQQGRQSDGKELPDFGLKKSHGRTHCCESRRYPTVRPNRPIIHRRRSAVKRLVRPKPKVSSISFDHCSASLARRPSG